MSDAPKPNLPHLSVVICGHVDSGKSTTTGRLLYELKGIPERELDKLRAEAEALGKSSFVFAFVMDRQKEEKARGVTIACTTKEFFTEKWHYTIIDAPGHRDFIKNMITGAAQADVALIMVPADGNFTTAIQKGSHKEGAVPGQTRQHARLINLLGVKQLIVGVNKMDCDVAGYKESRYTEIRDEMVDMMSKVGYKKDHVLKSIPVLPISGWKGDNLLSASSHMPWWKGVEVTCVNNNKHKITHLVQALNDFVSPPLRNNDAKIRMPVSGVYKIKGVGDVITGRIEQGMIPIGAEVQFVPSRNPSVPCYGKVFCVEMHHKRIEAGQCGDNVGINVKNLSRDNMPPGGCVMILKEDNTLKPVKSFTAQIQTLDVPGEIKCGYSPIGFVRTGRSACKLTEIKWKIGKETGGKKAESPASLKANEAAEVTFEPIQPLVCESFKDCEGLGRIAFLDGNTAVMLGKIVKVDF